MTKMSEYEKKKQEALVIFDLAKKFVSNLMTYIESEEADWIYAMKKTTLKSNTLTLTFALKDSGIEKEVNKLDKAQQKIDHKYPDLDKEELEEIPT